MNEHIRQIFLDLEPFEAGDRVARIGASTKDDYRWLRAWWEVEPDSLLDAQHGPWTETESYQLWCRQRTGNGKRWVPFAKGGAWSPFYASLSLVIDWLNDGAEIKKSVSEYRVQRGWSPHWKAELHNPDFYFRTGLTWPRRTNGLSFRALPAGSIFADKGPAAFLRGDHPSELMALAAVMNSAPFGLLVQLMVGRVSLAQSFEVGLIQSVPIPRIPDEELEQLAHLGSSYANCAMVLDRQIETSHSFILPALLQCKAESVAESRTTWEQTLAQNQAEFERIQLKIDKVAYRLYRIAEDEAPTVSAALLGESAVTEAMVEPGEPDDVELGELEVAGLDSNELVKDLLSYGLGVVVGRWDIRIGRDPSLAPKIEGPFDPLPVCSLGMLVGADGLPARPDDILDIDYPLRIDWDGILVDEPTHADDVVGRIREVFHLLWGNQADVIELEVSSILGVKQLRDYFRNPKGFFEHHIKRYSKSRRKAPIYWLLQSPKRNFAIWLYYQRLDPDILFKALVNYVEPKIRLEEDRLHGLDVQRGTTAAGGETRRLERAIEQQETLLSDLHEFRDRLGRAARLHLRPDLNDGVILNIAPLHELVPWKEAKRSWDELMAGKYEWSTIGQQLREKGLV